MGRNELFLFGENERRKKVYHAIKLCFVLRVCKPVRMGNNPDKLACFLNRGLVRFHKSVDKMNCSMQPSQFPLKIAA